MEVIGVVFICFGLSALLWTELIPWLERRRREIANRD